MLIYQNFRTIRSAYVQSPIEYNFHRSDQHRRATLLAELSSLNNVQIVLRVLQYDIIKLPISNQPLTGSHFRQVWFVFSETEKNRTLFLFKLGIKWSIYKSWTNRIRCICVWFSPWKYYALSSKLRRCSIVSFGLFINFIFTRFYWIFSNCTNWIKNSIIQR